MGAFSVLDNSGFDSRFFGDRYAFELDCEQAMRGADMTCKDCVHYNVCSPYTSPNESYPEVNGCKCFKDKSLYTEIPCKIGDEVYAVKPYRNCKRIYKGKVTQMYFVGEEMKLAIVVNTVVRGEWGKVVFATEEEAKRSIEGDSDAE